MKKRSPVGIVRHRSSALTGPLAGAALGLALAATQAPAAPPEANGQSIIVDGARLSESAARERAVQFVRTTGVASGETPAARWVAPICPEVLGLEDIGK